MSRGSNRRAWELALQNRLTPKPSQTPTVTPDAPPKVSRSRRASRAFDFEALFAFQLQASGAPQWERQYRFAHELGREWRWDFAWPGLKLAVEIQGGIWKKGGGAHSHPTDILRNMAKHNDGAKLGWRLLQFSTDEVKSGEGLAYTMTVIRRELSLHKDARHVP
jgi:very-short-patch-repair endonuclease